MATPNQIASGAVVLVASADQMVAGLDQAKSRVDRWGKQVESSVAATSARTTGLMESMRAKWVASQDTWANHASSKWGAWQAERARLVPHYDADNVARSKAMLAGLDQAGAKQEKDFAAINASALALKATIVALGVKIAQAFSSHYVEQFNLAMQRSRQLAADLEEAMAKRFASRQFDASRVSISSWAERRKEIESTEKSIDALQKRLADVRGRQEKLQQDGGLGKQLFGWIPGVGDRYKQVEEQLQQKREETERQLREEKRQLEAFKASLLANVFKNEVGDPLTKGVDQFMGKMQEFGSRVLANNRAILEDRKRQLEAIEQQLKAMEREALLYGMNAEQAKRLTLMLDGATDEQLAKYDRLVEHLRRLKTIEAGYAAPKLASAIEAGSSEAYALGLRLKGFDIGDGNAVAKESKDLLEKIQRENELFYREEKDFKKRVDVFMSRIQGF